MELNAQTVKKIIREELPALIRGDEGLRQFFLEFYRDEFHRIEIQAARFEGKTGTRVERILDELKRDREEQSKKWEENRIEQNKKWDAQEKKWEENQKELHQMITNINSRFNNTLGALGARWGLRSEASFRNGLKHILKELDVEVINVKEFDDKGVVFGKPEEIELDIIVINGKLLICELKSSISQSEIYTFQKKAALYEDLHNRKADRLIVISPMPDEKALKTAKKLNISVYSYVEELGEEIDALSGEK